MITTNVSDTALIFEGGGMRAAFSSGVVAALLEAGIHLDWVGGISAGSSCTVNYVSRDAGRAERSFVDVAAHPQFGDWRTWVAGKGMFNAEWIYEHTSLPHQVLPLDLDTFRANPAQVRIGAVRCADGRMVYWGREDLADVPALAKRVRASSTMPLLMPLTTIDGVDYCDGALGPTGGFALDAAQADGYDRFLVVMTRERGYRKPPVRSTSAMRVLFRRYPSVARALIERPANYNRSMAELLRLEREGRAYLVFPDAMPIRNSERRVPVLRSVFQAGRAQTVRELGAIREFLSR
ncbi:patatin-like phospholipase family protein [Tessaracoccus sp. G1721]